MFWMWSTQMASHTSTPFLLALHEGQAHEDGAHHQPAHGAPVLPGPAPRRKKQAVQNRSMGESCRTNSKGT